MSPLSRRHILTIGLTSTLGLAACSPAGLSSSTTQSTTAPETAETPAAPETSTPQPESTPAAPETSSATPEPTPTSTPTPTADPGSVMKGRSHNAAAEEYAYPAADVQAWLNKDSTPPDKLVFLTFDDGPNTSTTVQILDILKEYEVPATFFVIGRIVDDAPEVLKREVAEGHSVALHSYTHDYKKLYPGRKANVESIVNEFHKSKEAIRAILGEDFDSNCWRYPGGHMSWKNMEPADEALAAEGTHWIDWNCMTGDAEPANRAPKTVREMVNMAIGPAINGGDISVMLAHDTQGKDLTVKALPEIIEEYMKAGFKFGVIA